MGARFQDLFGRAGEPRVAAAPGRVNLIGEHTDYNDGWVLPMAIERSVRVAFAPREEPTLRAHSAVFEETREVGLEALESVKGRSWFAYIVGTAWALAATGIPLRGIDLLVDGDLPIGSGLSSSAALEMAVARALCALAEIEWQPTPMALAGQRAENEFVGVACGVMDPLVCAAARPEHALLVDCRSLEFEPVILPPEVVIVVLDTRTPRTLAGSAYNERRASCERAIRAIQAMAPEVRALRDVEPALLERARPRLDDTTFRRASHVVEECRRPAAMAQALGLGDFEAAGRLMDDSHASLRDLYEVSSRELDLACSLSRRHPTCYGARLTGAGFGGCAIALVATGGIEAFLTDVRAAYEAEAETPCRLFATRPTAGAGLLDPTESA